MRWWPAPRVPSGPPQLSVVVPAYRVEHYLDECLRSVLGQRVPLEVVVVDDGSPDRSGEIAESWARRDSRVRVIHQSNRGLGAARNAGVEASSAPYLTFCDSDDVVVDGAYAALLASAQRTGSEIVIGALERFDGSRSSMGPLMLRNHREPRSRVTVREDPLLLADVFSVNKVFSRQFWLAQGLAFPVGVRYEDQPALTRALLAASSIDVLTEVVYRWRIRADGSSITQGRAEVADLADRVVTKRDSTALVEAVGDPAVRTVWFQQVLPVDMWEYFRASRHADAEYWALLVSAMEEFWPQDERGFETTTVPVQQRLMGVLVSQDRRQDLLTLLAAIDERGVHVGADGVLELPFAGDPDLPPAAYTVSASERQTQG